MKRVSALPANALVRACAVWLAVFPSMAGAWEWASAPAVRTQDKHNAIWAQPLGAFSAFLGFTNYGPSLELPIGFTATITDHLSADVEMTVFRGFVSCGNSNVTCLPFNRLFASAGPTLAVGSEEPLHGFFVTPKLALALELTNGRLTPSNGEYVSTEASLGIDGGYRTTWRSVYLAFVIGVSFGRQWETFSSDGSDQHYEGYIVAPNINLLRVGGAF